MKTIHWLLAIAVTFTFGFWLGGFTSIPSPAEVSKTSVLGGDNSGELASISYMEGSDKLASCKPDISKNIANTYAEIEQLLLDLEENPKNKTAHIKLYSIISELSLTELETLSITLDSRNKVQRDLLLPLITSQLIELAPRKVLPFIEQYKPLPDSDPYLQHVKAVLAAKDSEFGFEIFEEDLIAADSDTGVPANREFISILAKHNLELLMHLLVQYKNKEIDISSELLSISYRLETSDEFSGFYDELRKLNDIGLLASPLMQWLEISPDDVFAKLNLIEDVDERKMLIEDAYNTWMYVDPETAANKRLADASNKKSELTDILRWWPDDESEQAWAWLSQQDGIDINSFKIQLLDELSYSSPDFLLKHLADVPLDNDEKTSFNHKIYSGLKRRSSEEAQQFLTTLSLSSQADVQALIDEKETPKTTPRESYRDSINKGFNQYFHYKEAKAFAVAIDDDGAFSWGYSVNRKDQQSANKAALEICQKNRRKSKVTDDCKIYAKGDSKLFNL
ncbi:hypothetical protein [Shewanella piezotolerans]|uniref:hypothetical protein n=1 Tax=Shewanella piezotolerans TaxID=404011 RepID=UPI0003267C00|nr:hypothetical protein [Shewanella piezotolerans]